MLTAAQAKDISTLLQDAIVTALKADEWLSPHLYHLFVEDKTGGATDIRKYHSGDGEYWIDDGVVLEPGASGWDSGDVSSPTVWIEGSVWYMLYEGRTASQDDGQLGLATSSDGLTWTKSGSNPVAGDATISWGDQVVPDDIYKEGSTYYLLMHGYTGAELAGYVNTWLCGCLTSTNLTTWTDPFGGPVQTDAHGYFAGNVQWMVSDEIDVIYQATGLYYPMWPTKAGGTRAATLSVWDGHVNVNGYTANVIVAVGTGTDWDTNIREPGNSLYEPLQYDDRAYKLWYTGHVTPYGSANSYIGYAYSGDGATWTKYASNPVVPTRSIEDPYIVTTDPGYVKWIMTKYVPLDALTTWTARIPMLAVLVAPGEQSPGASGAYEQRMDCSIEYRNISGDMTTGWAGMQEVRDRLMRWVKDECWGTGRFNGFLDTGDGWVVSGPTPGIDGFPIEDTEAFALAATVSFTVNLTVAI